MPYLYNYLTLLANGSVASQGTKADEPRSHLTAEASPTGLTGVRVADEPLAQRPGESRRAVAEPRAARVVLRAHSAVLAGPEGARGLLALDDVAAGVGLAVEVDRAVVDLKNVRRLRENSRIQKVVRRGSAFVTKIAADQFFFIDNGG